MLLLFLPLKTQAAEQSIKALVTEVKGEVVVRFPNHNKSTLLKENITLPEGAELTLTDGSSLSWYKQIYDNIEYEELYGPAIIQFPSKFVGVTAKISGQRTLGGIVRGDDGAIEAIECDYSDQIRLPKTKLSIPFLKFKCNQAPDYSSVNFVISQGNIQVTTGRFFDGFNNTELAQGRYKITFYAGNNRLVESTLVVEAFDLDSKLIDLQTNTKSVLPMDLMVTLELCQSGYRYLCETNLAYRFIAKDTKPMSTKDRVLGLHLKSMIRDSLNFN